ncbi:MAG: helix-turn-helix transcriptional regulator [Clostridia bacterium]|nr:helix-turn-helix transcriptional regulator [Clostridia bacterium]
MFEIKLKEIREEKGYTQQKVAELLAVHRTTYMKWENGLREPSNAMLIKIADLFDVSLDYLLGRKEY